MANEIGARRGHVACVALFLAMDAVANRRDDCNAAHTGVHGAWAARGASRAVPSRRRMLVRARAATPMRHHGILIIALHAELCRSACGPHSVDRRGRRAAARRRRAVRTYAAWASRWAGGRVGAWGTRGVPGGADRRTSWPTPLRRNASPERGPGGGQHVRLAIAAVPIRDGPFRRLYAAEAIASV